MKKETNTWYLSGFGIDKEYSIKGTELDKQLVLAFLDNDKTKCLELIKQGADMNVSLTIKSGDKIVAFGPLFQHLISEKPWKAKTAELNTQIENLKKRSKDNNHPSYLENEIKQLQAKKNQEIARTKRHNEKREAEIIDFAEFWLKLGGGRPLVSGVDYTNALALDKIDYPKVKEYVIRATEIERAIMKKLDDEKFGKDELEDKLYEVSAFYRNSGYTIEEIKEKVKNDPNLTSSANFIV